MTMPKKLITRSSLCLRIRVNIPFLLSLFSICSICIVAFPPEPTVSSSNVKEHIEIPDRWSGPKQYAQDYYSGGQVVLPSDGRADPSHLGPGDSEYSILDAEEEELAEEIEDEIQPLEADTCTSFFSQPQLFSTLPRSFPTSGTNG